MFSSLPPSPVKFCKQLIVLRHFSDINNFGDPSIISVHGTPSAIAFSVQQDKPHNHSEFGTSFEDALAKFKPATVNTKELREKAAELLAEAEAAEKMKAGVEPTV